jgi:2-oxo-3-hexenedioate decarboxylase
VKLGLTSPAKQQRMGIDSPLTGWLTDAMALEAGAPIPLAELIHPRIAITSGRRSEGVTGSAAGRTSSA